MQTRSVHDSLYEINIYGTEQGTVTTLQPAKIAFEISEEDDADVLKPMRKHTGYVRYIDTGGDYASLFPQTINDRYVEVLKDDALFWQGFLVPDSYSQDYDAAPFEVAIPCQSMIGALEAVRVTIPTDGKGECTLASMIVEAFDDLLGAESDGTFIDGSTRQAFGSILFPRAENQGVRSTFYNTAINADGGNIFTYGLFKYGFCEYDLTSPYKNANGYAGYTWYDALSKLLQIWGACLRQYDGNLYLTIPTREDDYDRYTWSALRGGCQTGPSHTFASKLSLLDSVKPQSTDNTYSIDRPKKSVKLSVKSEEFDYKISVDNDEFTTPVSSGNATPSQYYDYYVMYGSCATAQPNITLTDAQPYMVDAWLKSDDANHKKYSYTKGIKVPGNTSSAPSALYVGNCEPAFTIHGSFPFRAQTAYSGLVITGSALKKYVADETDGACIYASLRIGDVWWGGGRWMTGIDVQSLGAQPVFKIPLTKSGQIDTNANLTVTQYREHSDKSGYLMPYDSSLVKRSTEIAAGYDNIPILTIYKPFGYGSDDFQVITNLSMEYTQEVTPATTIGIDKNMSALEGWTHKRMSDSWEKLLNDNCDEEYSLTLNCNSTKNNGGWYAPDIEIQNASRYAVDYYKNAATKITIGEAYAAGVEPNAILKRGGVEYKILSIGMNTYDDCGSCTVFKTSIGTE